MRQRKTIGKKENKNQNYIGVYVDDRMAEKIANTRDDCNMTLTAIVNEALEFYYNNKDIIVPVLPDIYN